MKDLKARVHSMSMDFPSRDAGSRGEELASEALADDFYALGLKTDIDGFECPGNLRISRSIYLALIVVAGLVCFLMPTMRIMGLILGVAGIVLSYFSYNGTDFLGSVVSKFESQNVIAKYVPEGMPTGTKRTKFVVVAHYDVKKPSIFQMPSVRKYWKIARLVVIGSAIAVPVCCILGMLPFLEVLSLFFGIVALIASIILLIEIVDQLLGSFLKTPKGSNCNASGLTVMLELAKKLVTSEVQSPEDDDEEEGVIEEFGEDYSDLEDSEYRDEYREVSHEAASSEDVYENADMVSDGWAKSEPDATVAPVEVISETSNDAQGEDYAVAGEAASMNEAAQAEAAQAVQAGQVRQPEQANNQIPVSDVDSNRRPVNDAGEAAVATAQAVGSASAAAVSTAPVAAPAPAQVAPVSAPAPMPAPRPRKASKPSWWSKVEDEKKHGEFDHGSSEPTLRSRYADAPASKDAPVLKEEYTPQEVSDVPNDAAAPFQPAQQSVSKSDPQPVMQAVEQSSQQATTRPAQQSSHAPAMQSAPAPASASAAPAKPLAIDFGEQNSKSKASENANHTHRDEVGAANNEKLEANKSQASTNSANEHTKSAEANSQIQEETPQKADEQTEQAAASSAPAPDAKPAPDANSTVAYTPRPVSEVLDELDESIQAMGKKTIERKAMPERPEPYQEPLVEPDTNSSAEWPSGSYKYSRNRAKYRKEETQKQSYDALAQDPEVGVLDFSRERYQSQIEQKNQQAAQSADTQGKASDSAQTSAAADVCAEVNETSEPQTTDAVSANTNEPTKPATHNSHRKYDVNETLDTHASDDERSSLLNLPIVGSKNTAAAPSSAGLADPNTSFASTSWQADQVAHGDSANDTFIAREDVSDSSSLTGAFAPLGASGVMEPVTAEMLEQYNEGQTLYVDDAEDNYDEGYSDQGSYMNEIQIDMPKRKLFGRKKDKKKKNRKGKGYDASANEWLGVDEGYNATQEGAKIGSWDNFSENPSDDYDYVDTGKSVWDSWDDYDEEDNDWRGGAYGGETYEQNRDAIQALSDELLNKEVWFVALGSSDAGSAGMLNLLKTHEKDLKNARIINLECIGSGKLCFTCAEPNLLQSYRVDPRMQKLVKKAAHTAKVDMERVKLDWRSTEATPAVAKRHRAITITALEDGVVPGWKWADDNDDSVSNGNLNAALKVLVEIVKAC